jgi:hypothetical protein
MKNANIETVKTIWNDLSLDENTAVLKIAREFEKERFTNLDDTARKFIAYKDGEDFNPIELLNEAGMRYNF